MKNKSLASSMPKLTDSNLTLTVAPPVEDNLKSPVFSEDRFEKTATPIRSARYRPPGFSSSPRLQMDGFSKIALKSQSTPALSIAQNEQVENFKV